MTEQEFQKLKVGDLIRYGTFKKEVKYIWEREELISVMNGDHLTPIRYENAELEVEQDVLIEHLTHFRKSDAIPEYTAKQIRNIVIDGLKFPTESYRISKEDLEWLKNVIKEINQCQQP